MVARSPLWLRPLSHRLLSCRGAAAACESALRSLARGIMETVKTGKEAINSVSPVLVSAWPHILAALT